jgi:hypothetical protein
MGNFAAFAGFELPSDEVGKSLAREARNDQV